MSTSSNSINRSDRREAVRTLAVAALHVVDRIEREKLAALSDIRATLEDALQWGHGSRLPRSAKVYRKAQQTGEDIWWGNLIDGDGEELACVLHTLFDWITDSNDRRVDLDDGMGTLRAAVDYHVRERKLVLSAACTAAGYDESRLVEHHAAPSCAEHDDEANVVSLEDARMNRELAAHDAAITELEKEVAARRVEIGEMTDLVRALLPARGRHLTLVVSNDVRRSDDAGE